MENFATEFMTKLDGKLTLEQMKTVLAELEMFSANFDIEKKITEIVPYQDCIPECYKVYLVSKKIEGMSPQSLRTYKCNLDDFFQTVNKPLNQITTNDIRVYLFGLSAKGNTNRTIDGKRLIIHTFLDWCVKEEYLLKNPCSRINPIKFEAKPREPLSDIELELVRDACKDYREKALVELFYSTGWHKSPKVGALVIFRNGSHVGSVQKFDSSRIYTNEGNTSSAAGVVANGGATRNKSYAISDSAIDGYVWIDWGSEGQTTVWKATGTATSAADDLYIRESPNGYVIGKINKGNRVEINGEKSGAWTKIKVAGIGIGWVATKYLAVDGAKNVAATATTIAKKQDKNQRLYTGQVTASSLNVRTWAGAEYPNIKKYPTLNKGNKVDVMNFTQKASDGSSWYYIRIAGKYFGFVSAKHIKKA